MFTKEGLNITPNEFFYTRWNSETSSLESTTINGDEIDYYLHLPVTLHNVRLKHVLMPLLESKILPILYKRNYWNEIVQEILTYPWKDYPLDIENYQPDGEDIEFLEVYEVLDYNTEDNCFYNTLGLISFHAVGFPFKNPKLAERNYSSVGQFLNYSISAQSITEYMNYPLRIGKMSLSKDSIEIIKEAEMTVTLDTLISAITWDMSFYGMGEKRAAFLK